MIVMAIQAAHQTADEIRGVKGYELRDITIGKALIVPQEEEGVETMLHFRPWKLGSRAPTAVWQEFTVFSKARDQDWQQHCSGLISVSYKSETATMFKNEEDAENLRYQQEHRCIQNACPIAESSRQFYESLETIALRYGATFQNIVDIKSGDFKGGCTVRIPNTKDVMPMQYEYPHVIHPCTLDNIFQMVLPGLTGINESLRVAMVPTFLESLYVSSDVSSTPGDELQGYSYANKPGFQEAEASVVVSDATWNHPHVIVKNLRCTSLSAMTENIASTESASNIRKLCAELIWKEDLDLLTKNQATTLFRSALSAYKEYDPTVIEELELGAFIYIDRVLKCFTPEQAQNFAPHLLLYYNWMRHQHDLALRGGLEHQSTRIDWLHIDDIEQAEILKRVASDTVDGRIMCRVGDHLNQIMKSEIEPLQVMLENDLIYDFYRYGVGMNEAYSQLTAYVETIAHKRPDINILEIGAGTGGTTLPLLKALGGNEGSSPRFSSYTFSDISSGFFEKAQENFKEWSSCMQFKKLNIETDPIQQGFENATYDVIIAANVSKTTFS